MKVLDRKFLNSFQLKIIALITMTIDHLGFFRTLTNNPDVNSVFRIIGRISAILFLFVLVEGLHHTRSKPKYILRLYVAGVVTGIVNHIFGSYTHFRLGNIFFTFFYAALFIYLIEYIISNLKNKKVFIGIIGLILPFLLILVHIYLIKWNLENVWHYLSIILPSPFTVDYSILFILLGVMWHFINNKVIDCILLAIFSLLSKTISYKALYSTSLILLKPTYFKAYVMFLEPQWWMILAIPFILLYNGKKGKSFKYLFYAYYPIHVYILALISYLRH